MRDGDGSIKAFCSASVLLSVVIVAALLPFCSGCTFKAERRGIPPDVEAAVGSVSDDIEQGRYEKIYKDASDLWRQAATLEQSEEVFKKLKTRLGKVENRTLHSATEQHNSGGPLKGRAFIISYQTKFEHGEGMETFTFLEKDHNWLLARYFVNSTALQ